MEGLKIELENIEENNENLKFYEICKRGIDIIGAGSGLLLLSPVIAIVACAVKFTSKGPIFFSQKRVGKNGQLFDMYKFRSMVVNAEELKEKLVAQNEMSGPMFKMKDDPRVTKVGKFIRKTSIDELPQLWNVLKGDMSLVGPRPSLPKEVAQFEDWMHRRLEVKPGLTCYWQVSGRNNIDFEDWMKLDIRYVEERNLFVDIKLIFKTIFVLFGDKNASGIVLLKSFNDYWNGYEDNHGKYHPGYVDLLEKLETEFPLGSQIVGEQAEKDFIRLFGTILSMRNILSSFDQFAEMDDIAARDLQDYQSIYLDLYDRYRRQEDAEKEDITDDIEFEIELIKQVEINIDYILMLVEKYHDGNCEDKEILASIRKAVDASIQLRSKKDLIEAFISHVNVDTQVTTDWRRFVLEQEESDLTEIITSEKLKSEETRKFVDNTFRDGAFKTTGTEIDKLMPPVSRFGGGGRAKKKQGVIEKLKVFFDKYFGLGIAEFRLEEQEQSAVYETEPSYQMVAEESVPYGN